jgi:hypothetical protein
MLPFARRPPAEKKAVSTGHRLCRLFDAGLLAKQEEVHDLLGRVKSVNRLDHPIRDGVDIHDAAAFDPGQLFGRHVAALLPYVADFVAELVHENSFLIVARSAPGFSPRFLGTRDSVDFGPPIAALDASISSEGGRCDRGGDRLGNVTRAKIC